ncbi:MarR family winged helix-turn-helix transcriptional regulator [Streptomyces sp. NPDC004726]
MTASAQTSELLLLALRRLRTDLASYDRAVADAARLKESDLTVLEVLHREGPRTPTALARRTSTHLATMTGVLTRLEKEGWIERHPDATDRRSIRIHATSVERFKALYADGIERLDALFQGWTAEQAQAFLSAVDDISQAMEALVTTPTDQPDR